MLLHPESHYEVNALQRAADIIVQKSVREGFGLTVTEAMWKGKPVIGGAAGGIVLQLRDFNTGFLSTLRKAAPFESGIYSIIPRWDTAWGRLAKEFVRNHFLVTRNVRDYLAMMILCDNPGHRTMAI